MKTRENASRIDLNFIPDRSKINPKSIVDAGRRRRTPRTLATDGKTFESKKSAGIGDAGAEKK
jgi:hypothetical protein